MPNVLSTISSFFKKELGYVNTNIPVKVVKINGNKVDVQPLIQNQRRGPFKTVIHENQPPILDVEVGMVGGGGYAGCPPISVGDQGWVIVFQRDIRTWKLTRQISRQRSKRRFHRDDCVYVGEFYKINQAIPTDGFYIYNPNKNFLAVKADKVETDLDIHCKNIVSENITAKEINADNLTTPVASFNTHIHSGVTPGNGNTGGAING